MTRLAINIRNLFRPLNFVGTFHFALHDSFGTSVGNGGGFFENLLSTVAFNFKKKIEGKD